MAGAGLSHRLDVAARIAAATAGGYAIAALVAIAGAWALPVPPLDAAAAATIAALIVPVVAAMGCFWARSAARAWAGVLLWAAGFAAIALFAGWRP